MPSERLRFSADFDADVAAMLESARRMGLEGVIGKRKDAVYESRRTETWLKLKNKQRQEFVVAGYTDRSSGEAQVGSLLLAVHDEGGELVYVGNVGTGWSAATAAALKTRLKKIEVDVSPFGSKPLHRHRWAVREPSAQHWVKPTLVAEVEFSDWTPDSQVRHAKFLGLRADKEANDGASRERGDAGRAGRRDGQREQHGRRHQGLAPRTRDRPEHRRDQARTRALLRIGGRLDAAAPEGPALLAGARADRRGRRAVLPEARGVAADRRHQGARPRVVARAWGPAGGADEEGARRLRRR